MEPYEYETDTECIGCKGWPCQKTHDRGLIRKVERVLGRTYIRRAACRYAAAEELAATLVEKGIPRRYAGKNYDDYEETVANRAALKAAHWYANNSVDKWLYIVGGYGTGKTFLASLIGRSFQEKGENVLFRDVATFYDETRNREAWSERYRELSKVPVLILDDLGSNRGDERELGQLYRLINDRYNDMKRLVITSNWDYDGLKQTLGKADQSARIVSRLAQMSVTVYLGVEDRRDRR